MKFLGIASILFSIYMCTSCSSAEVTNEELKAVNKVLDIYGGRCVYGFKYEATAKERKKYFTLTMSESADLESLADIPELPASGIAYTFYSNLQVPRDYTHIQTILEFKDGKKKAYVYAVDQLKAVQRHMGKVYGIISLIQSRNYAQLKSLLNDSSYINYDKNAFLAKVEDVENEHGVLKEFVPVGFKFTDMDTGSVNLHISGMTLRVKEFVRFSVDLDTTDKSERVIVFNYKY